jgi:hypothetical protein
MYLIREVMHCKPGQVRMLVEKFRKADELMKQKGFPVTTRVMTDVSGERYWTLVAEQEVPSLDQFAEESRRMMADFDIQAVMKGYHDLVQDGYREIYMIESPK